MNKDRIQNLYAVCVFLINYFLKKSGILIDCSFTLLVGVLGVSKVGVVPPTGLLGADVVPPPCVGAAPKSNLGEA